MTKPGRSCIYCGGTELTHEHIWADWLKIYSKREMTSYTTETALIDVDKINLKRKKYQGDPLARKVRRVCRTCNNGWMSRLQETTKPSLVPLPIGSPATLHKRDLRLLSAWIAMATMIAEFDPTATVAISQEERTFLRMNPRPPSHWRIWIGCYSNTNFRP